MALTYDVCQLRPGTATLRRQSTGALERTIKTHQTTWEVIAKGIADPSEVDEVMAAQAFGLPTLGSSVYVDKQTGQVYPYFFCTSKTATRDRTNAYRFEVQCVYKDEEGDESPQDKPSDPENLCPVVTFSSEEAGETAWNGDNVCPDTPTQKAILLPTGEFYDSAVVRRKGALIVTHKQYENVFSEADFRARIFHVNTGDYRGYPGGHALITGITWSKVQVPVIGDITVASNLVTYTINCVETSTLTLLDNGNTTSMKIGHHAVRIREDTQYLEVANDAGSKVSYNTKFPNTIGRCFLKTTGEKHDQDKQTPEGSVAPLDKWRVQPDISFSFLRECP